MFPLKLGLRGSLGKGEFPATPEVRVKEPSTADSRVAGWGGGVLEGRLPAEGLLEEAVEESQFSTQGSEFAQSA